MHDRSDVHSGPVLPHPGRSSSRPAPPLSPPSGLPPGALTTPPRRAVPVFLFSARTRPSNTHPANTGTSPAHARALSAHPRQQTPLAATRSPGLQRRGLNSPPAGLVTKAYLRGFRLQGFRRRRGLEGLRSALATGGCYLCSPRIEVEGRGGTCAERRASRVRTCGVQL